MEYNIKTIRDSHFHDQKRRVKIYDRQGGRKIEFYKQEELTFMAGKGTSSDTIFDVEQFDDEVFRVRKPDTNSSREIRDDILRNFFGYTEMDISALDRENTGYFYISDKRDPRNWATYIHVTEWQTDNQGKVPITMPIKLIDNLVNFRDQRIFTAITTAAGAISDAGAATKIHRRLEQNLEV